MGAKSYYILTSLYEQYRTIDYPIWKEIRLKMERLYSHVARTDTDEMSRGVSVKLE